MNVVHIGHRLRIALGSVAVVTLFTAYLTVVHGVPARVVVLVALSFVSGFTAAEMRKPARP